MWQNVKPYRKACINIPENSPERPHVRATIMKTDWSHSLLGAILGLIIAVFNIVTLSLFFNSPPDNNLADEYLEKVTRCVSNTFGIAAVILGFTQIQKLSEKFNPEEVSVDSFLLNLGATFTYAYLCFTITVGIYTTEIEEIPSSLHILNGILGLIQISAQVVFINLLLKQAISSMNDEHPGRQITTFLIMYNFTLWLVDTFELQKSKASEVESVFYGAMTWVWLQRLTLPLVIFFRFHSTVVLIDCWKNSYKQELKSGDDDVELKQQYEH